MVSQPSGASQCTGEICPDEGESAPALLQMRKNDLAQTELDHQSESGEESNDLEQTVLEHQIEGDDEAFDEADEEASLSMGASNHDDDMAANSSTLMSCTQMSLNSAQTQILYAWTTDHSRPYNVRPTQRIFQLCQEAIESRVSNMNNVVTTKGSDVMNMDKSANSAVGIKGSYGAFRAEASFKMGSNSKSSTKKQYWTFNNWWSKKRVYWKSSFQYKYLTQEAKDILTKYDPADIVRLLGEFYARTIYAGGLLVVDYELEYKSSLSSSDVAAKFKAKYGMSGFNIGTSASHKKNSSKLSEGSSVTESWKSVGGDSSIWSGLKTDLSNKAKIQEEWAYSIDDENMMPSKMELTPIWNLLKYENPAKSNQLKTYLQSTWRVRPGNVQILRYHEDHIKSTMDACTLVRQKGGCWNLDDLGTGCNSLGSGCLKWGAHCHTGDIVLPPGIKAEVFLLWFGSDWNNACNPKGWAIQRKQILTQPGLQRTPDKPCAYKFSISDTQNYVC